MSKLLTGWKAIEEFVGVSRTTIRKYKKKGFPLRRWPGGKPYIDPDEVKSWKKK